MARKKIKEKAKEVKKEIKEEVFLNIPNSITILRLILVFVFIYMLFKDYSKLYLIVVFSVAAVSDWFDGFFARRLKQTTTIGALMDFALNLPKTKHRASEILDFPLPFGPKIILIPFVNSSSVFFGKLLKPYITSFLIWVIGKRRKWDF